MRGALALLDVDDDGTATGPFLSGYASFMALRHDPAAPFDHASTPVADEPAVDSTSTVDPASLRDNDAWGFFAQLHLPGVRVRKATADDGDTGTRLIAPDGSWALAWNTPEDGRFLVTQAGPTRLWDIVEQARQRWAELGQPSWEDFRITITPHRQHIHLATPGNEHMWELARGCT